jgi:hypothetical protein
MTPDADPGDEVSGVRVYLLSAARTWSSTTRAIVLTLRSTAAVSPTP